MIGRRRSAWEEEEEEEEEEEDRRVRKKRKEISVRGSAFRPFILEQKDGWDTHAAMSNKFPVSCCTKKTLIETSRRIYKRKVQTLSGTSFESTTCSKLKIHIPSNIVQAAFNEK